MSGRRGNCSWDVMYERIILIIIFKKLQHALEQGFSTCGAQITFHRGCLRFSGNRYLHYDS